MTEKIVNFVAFPWAGGTSQIYKPLVSSINNAMEKRHSSVAGGSERQFLFEFQLDLPGRLMRSSEEAIADVPTLVDFVVKELFTISRNKNNHGSNKQDEPLFVLFGHSFGAILAFEVTKKLEEIGMSPPLALFVSASRPPSADSLVSAEGKSVSDMSLQEMSVYFKSRGSTYNFDIQGNEVTKLFVQGVKADYKCLETYLSNQKQIGCPLIAMGGDKDLIASTNDIHAWERHQKEKLFQSFILKGKGHFYLDDSSALRQLAKIIVCKTQDILDGSSSPLSSSLISSSTETIFGNAHHDLQQFDAVFYPPEVMPTWAGTSTGSSKPVSHKKIQTWTTANDAQKFVSTDIQSWFPSDDEPAFYVPTTNHDDVNDGANYSTITYRQLHENIELCPQWNDEKNDELFVVAVLLPLEWMTEAAIVQLCIMANGSKASSSATAAAPLDPRMNRETIIQALDQLNCKGIVSTHDLLQSKVYGQGKEQEKSIAYNFGRLIDVRIIEQNTPWSGFIQWCSNSMFTESTNESTPLNIPELLHVPPSKKEREHPILLLRTSGTTAIPKIVPLYAPALLYNAQCQIRAMNITRDDCTLNAMPLFHIGGLSCSFFTVLVSGSSVIHSGPFQPKRFVNQIIGHPNNAITPTWYNAVPTIHSALMLHILGEGESMMTSVKTRNRLRFIRSGAAPIAPATVNKLSQLFDAKVINSYALSECMPVCVQTFDSSQVAHSNGGVGVPVGPSVRVIDKIGNTLPYGVEGEVAIKGPGVIPSYLGISTDLSHTKDGWLRTGDVGTMDQSGQVFLSGRSKELIKRGGEQVWPVQVDKIIEELSFVNVCVTFGVPNELYGEEVASAIVSTKNGDENTMRKAILKHCRSHLDLAAIPTQIVFLDESQLLKGSSGKFLRSKFAEHLGITQSDVGALQILSKRVSDQFKNDGENTESPLPPSPALKGVRIVASIFVAMNHIGFFPSLAWGKIQSFNISIPIFFILGAFNLAATTRNYVNWAHFVGTRIGGLHSLFLISQVIALPSYFIFACTTDCKFPQHDCKDYQFWLKELLLWVFATVTGMAGIENSVNRPTWFITVFYQFLIIFPFLYRFTMQASRQLKRILFVTSTILSCVTVYVLFLGGKDWWKASRYIVAYIPTLYASMLAGYFFAQKNSKSMDSTTRNWGRVTDLISCVLLLLVIYVALSRNCLWMKEQDAIDIRSQYDIPQNHSHNRVLHDHKHTDIFFPVHDTVNDGSIDSLRFNKFSFIQEIEDAYHEYRIILPHSNFNSSGLYDDLLPLQDGDYPISNNARVVKMLKDETTATSVIDENDLELIWNISDLLDVVGGPPTHPSSDERNDFWNQLRRVMEMRMKRRTSKARSSLRSEFQLPRRWKDMTVDEVAEAVHDEYPGFHQSEFLSDLVNGQYGPVTFDYSVIPRRSISQFLHGITMLSELNSWSTRVVGPHSFGAKWHVGRARPEEIVWAIKNDFSHKLSVPYDIRKMAKKFRISCAEAFTAYKEGSPTHPSWPAMHSAASSMSFWLQIVLNLTPRQLCEAKKVDYAVAFGRTVAGVHYEDDNIDGLNLGQFVVSQEIANHLNTTYPGSDMTRLMDKLKTSRFDWNKYMPLEKCHLLPEQTRYSYGTLANDGVEYKVCGITFHEFKFLHDNGIVARFITPTALYIGILRLGTPLVLLWIYGLAHGQGVTAWLLSRRPFVMLSPYTYHLYLLHVPVSKYIWLLIYGSKFEFWWPMVPAYPIPVKWWVFFLIVFICLVLGWLIEEYLVKRVQPFTIQVGVSTCTWIAKYVSRFYSGGSTLTKNTSQQDSETKSLLGIDLTNLSNLDDLDNSSDNQTNLSNAIMCKIEGISGVPVSRSTPLRDLGLDSLGGTALLSSLKYTIPEAKDLTMTDLTEECNSVGDLVHFLSINSGIRHTTSDNTNDHHDDNNNNDGSRSEPPNESTERRKVHEVLKHLEGITGIDVELSTPLKDLGLDSLGGTALMGALRSTIPEAKDLVLSDLNECETVYDLVIHLSISLT